MALFSSASRSVKLYFTADSTQVDRALAKTETRLKRFERVAGRQSTLNSGLIGGFSKGGAVTAGFGLAALGLKGVITAAEDAQAVQAKLQVSTENAGLSYEQYAKQINTAIQAQSKLTGLDDERLSETFSNLVRTTKDVGQALRLMGTAADLARTKGISLEAASSLLARAYNGNFKGLNRLGLSITPVTAAQDRLKASTQKATVEQMRAAKAADALATKQKAVGLIEATFAGQAAAYGKTAVGATDRLKVSVENLQESLGGGLLPVFTKVVDEMNAAVNAASLLGNAFKGLGVTGSGLGKAIEAGLLATPGLGTQIGEFKLINKLFGGKGTKGSPDVAGGAAAFDAQFGLGALTAAGQKANPRKGFKVGKANGPTTGVSDALRNQELDARLSGSRSRLKAVLAKEQAFLKNELKSTLPKDQAPLKEALLGVTDEIKSINDEILQDAKDKKQALKDQAAKIAAARKALAEKLRQQAADFKSKALDLLNLQSSRRDDDEALRDAKANLKVLRQLGSKGAIHKGQIAVADARDQVLRDRIQAATFKANGNGTFNVHIGNLNLNGVQNPKQLLAELQKAGRRGTHQSRGTIAGRNFNVGIG